MPLPDTAFFEEGQQVNHIKGIALALATSLAGSAALADAAAALGKAWRAALAPAAQQGPVLLSPDITLKSCTLSFAFTSNGGKVTDRFTLPLAALDIAASRAQSTAGQPSKTGLSFILHPGKQGESVKTLANGMTRTRPVSYAAIFPENLVSDKAALALLDEVLAIAARCDETS